MSITTYVAIGAYSLSALGFVAFAASFGLRDRWEPWHSEAVGKPWEELDASLRTVVLAIMRAAASGGLALAFATTYLIYRLAQGDASAIWALPLVTLGFAIPGTLVALRFRQRTAAKPPLGPAFMGVLIPLVGLAASLL